MALAAILASVDPKPLIVHITHDLRSPDLTSLDRDAVAELADTLGCEFVHDAIQTRDLPGNQEQNARNARYDKLAQIAIEHSVRFIATGHHADDQLESMIMNLARGAGPRGLSGIQDTRVYRNTTIIRPMLGITHDDAVDLCHEIGIRFTHDHTNDDCSLTRNRLRHEVIPVLKEFRPEIASRASVASDGCRATMDALRYFVRKHLWNLGDFQQSTLSWKRDALRDQPDAALVELLRLSIEHLCDGSGFDRLNNASLHDVVRCVTDSSTEPRSCRLGPIVVKITARAVVISPYESSLGLSIGDSP
ncbi:MAG: tRNA lysidine(34) synthetase TilS [Phycisphaerales bacterium]|nr:tRNA lysidine(34) synthetase TilS [Phycisphaerales bacterium]